MSSEPRPPEEAQIVWLETDWEQSDHEADRISIDHLEQPPSDEVTPAHLRRAYGISANGSSSTTPSSTAETRDMIEPTRLGPIEPPPPPPPRFSAWGWVIVSGVAIVAFLGGWAAALLAR